MTNKTDDLGIADTSSLTDSDWAEINKLKRAYDEGGVKALSKALEELKKTGKARLRLSGRDDKTFWAMVIKGRLAELREKPKSKELLSGKCMDFYTAKMTDRMTE